MPLPSFSVPPGIENALEHIAIPGNPVMASIPSTKVDAVMHDAAV